MLKKIIRNYYLKYYLFNIINDQYLDYLLCSFIWAFMANIIGLCIDCIENRRIIGQKDILFRKDI